MSDVTGYRLDAVHAFRVRTLRALGYRTRVVLGNKSDQRAEWATPYRVDVSVTGASRQRVVERRRVARVMPGGRLALDCEPFVAGLEGDVELVLHLVPELLAERANDGKLSLSREQLYFYLSVQDHYVEYYREDGFCAGVLYQSGAFNYELFSRERSTLIQAPKCYLSEELDTFMSVVNSSADPDYAVTAELRCELADASGRALVRWVESIPPFSAALLSLRDRVRELVPALGPTPRFYCFYAASTNATLLPLTIHRNDRTGAIGLEHSLPPIYYAAEARGPVRARAIQAFLGTSR